jgi:hypothetical protein
VDISGRSAPPNSVKAVDVSAFRVYPNPSSGRINIITAEGQGPITVTISGMDGKILHTASTGPGKETGFSHDLENGIYLMQLSSQETGSFVIRKLVVVRE